MHKNLEELQAKLRLAEENYRETKADCYLVECHRLRDMIAEMESAHPSHPIEDEQQDVDTPDDGTFTPPFAVDQLQECITKYLLDAYGREELSKMSDKELVNIQIPLLENAQRFYTDNNDQDAMSVVDGMIIKAHSIIAETETENTTEETPVDGNDTDAGDTTTEEKPAEEQEMPAKDTKATKTSKTTTKKRNAQRGQKKVKK